jgi:WYL domain
MTWASVNMERSFRVAYPRLMGDGAKKSGRVASASFVVALRDALANGRPSTYRQLAERAGCTERTVRNYLAHADDTLGFKIRRTRGTDHAVRVYRHEEASGAALFEKLGRALAWEVLRNVFPLSGTALESPRNTLSNLITVSTRGTYRYGEKHLSVLRRWLTLASSRPRRAVRFGYESADGVVSVREAWPVGMVLRDAARVFLAGVPAEATDGRTAHTYALEFVDLSKTPALEPLDGRASGQPPPRLDNATVADFIDAPFSMFRPDADRSVRVRASFTPAAARYVRNRDWHAKQSFKTLSNGGVELSFGPAHRAEVESWLRGWGKDVTASTLTPVKRRSKE